MKIAPLKVSDPWFARIASDATVHTDALSGVPVETTVEIELVELLHEGPEENFRPYLHLRGELVEVKPSVELPYGVSELALRHGSGLPLDAFYGFTKAQLTDLVAKGYFTSAFRVPDEMSGIPWTLPGTADFMVVAPEFTDQAPIVFMAVHDQAGMQLDQANSGYELSAYFPDYSADAKAAEEAQSALQDGPVILEHAGDEHDVFSDITFEPADAAPTEPIANEGVRAIVPDGVFSRLVEEIEARQKPPVVALVEEQTEVVDGPSAFEQLYLARVDPGVNRVLAGEHVEDEATQHDAALVHQNDALEAEAAEAEVVEDETSFLDLSADDPELEPFNLQGREVEDEQRLAAERRAARLRAEAAAMDSPEGDDQQLAI